MDLVLNPISYRAFVKFMGYAIEFTLNTQWDFSSKIYKLMKST